MSFLKKVAKVAAPFASFLPGIGPLIGAGLGLVGSLGGGSKSSSSGGAAGSNGMNSQLMSQLLSGVTQQQGMSKDLFNKGNSLIDAGMGTMGKATDYYSNILAGGPGANKALAGPMSDLTTGYNRSMQNTAQFGARSGTNASSMSNRGPQLAGAIARLKTDSLDNAGKSLLSAGQGQASIGGNLAAGGTAGYGQSLATLLGIRGQDLQEILTKMNIDAQNSQGMGQGIGNLLGTLLGPGGILNSKIGGIFGGKSGGSSGGGSILGGKGGGTIGTGGKG